MLAKVAGTRPESQVNQDLEQAGLHRQDQGDLVGEPQRRVLRLVEDRADPRAARQLVAHPGVRHAAEAGEHLQFEELRVVEPQRLRRVAQRARLGLAADPADAGADVDRRLLPLVEQLGVEHDLAVGDRDQIGRDIGAEIAGVGLGDRQRGQRAAALFLGQLRGALQQPRMDIEDIAGIGLAAGRLARQQRDLAVAGGVFGQVVDDDQRVLAAVAEILRHGEAGERRDPLQAGRARRAGDDDDAALRRAIGLDRVDRAPHAGALLADRDIDADDVAGLLVDDGVDRRSWSCRWRGRR